MEDLGLSGPLKIEELRSFLRRIDPTLSEQDASRVGVDAPATEPYLTYLTYYLNLVFVGFRVFSTVFHLES